MWEGGPLGGEEAPPGAARPKGLPRWGRAGLVAATCAAFLLVIFVRGGPNPSENDAHAVTDTATAISHGDLAGAAKATVVPNPPGYPLLTSPLVLVLRPWVGAPRWCDDKAIPEILRHGPGTLFYRSLLSPCGQSVGPARPVWYRSQALLTVLAFLVLALGALALAKEAAVSAGREVGLLLALVALPATTDAVAQSFHPQDIMSVGFAFLGAALALRRRWVVVGLAFGAACVCKQFALLAFIAVLAAAPTWRARVHCVLSAVGVVGVVVLPFYVADRADTVHALTAVYVAGVTLVKTPTVLGQLGIDEQTKVEVARDAPLVGALLLAAACRRWRGNGLLAPAPLVGLVLACFAARLVFEVGMFNYYFLAVGAGLVVLDVLFARLPVRAVVWVVATRYGLTAVAARASPVLTAVLFLAAALAPVMIGMRTVAVAAPVTGTESRELPSAPGS